MFTYNATGYLETLASNVPTILYFNSKDNPIRANSEPYFEQLKKVNIFDDIFEATKHINSIWSNIDSGGMTRELKKQESISVKIMPK